MRVASVLVVALLAALSPTVADAGPLVTLVNVAWIKAGAALTGVFGATVGKFLLQLGTSVLLSRISAALTGKPRQQEIYNKLQQPSSLPEWRFPYGKCMAPGSPAPVRVKGYFIYACFLLSSRESVGPFDVYFDKRKVESSGDPYDFSGVGATATNAPFAGHVNYWIGRGDQLGPPDVFLAEAGEFYSASDAWRGCTVLWVKLNAGAVSNRNERWPRTPPEVLVDGYWSKVWDPRDPTQSASDKTTWKWSANHGLCVYDALRNNPLRPYSDAHLWHETFVWDADVSDEDVAVQGGGTIPRYEVNGLLVFSEGAELEDQVIPMAQSGAARFTRVAGRLGLIPGVYVAPSVVLDDFTDAAPLSYMRDRPAQELVTSVSAIYSNPARFYEDAETPVHVLAGAAAEDGGVDRHVTFETPFATDHRQAQRVAKILGMRSRMQKTLSGVFPPAAFELVGGSAVTVNFPSPIDYMNTTYEVEESHPGMDILGDDGVAVSVALSLRVSLPVVYEWSYTEEKAIPAETFDASIGVPESPAGLSAAVVQTGTTIQIAFDFLPSPSPSVIAYEWDWSDDSGVSWVSGGSIDPATISDGKLYGYLSVVGEGTYSLRVRASALTGSSAYIVLGGIVVDAEIIYDGGEY